jgi:hypothetical protein
VPLLRGDERFYLYQRCVNSVGESKRPAEFCYSGERSQSIWDRCLRLSSDVSGCTAVDHRIFGMRSIFMHTVHDTVLLFTIQ